jgi:hypothetical protein
MLEKEKKGKEKKREKGKKERKKQHCQQQVDQQRGGKWTNACSCQKVPKPNQIIARKTL